MSSSVTLNPVNTSIVTMNGIKEQSVLKLAPDMFCVIRDSSTMTIVANDLTALETYKNIYDLSADKSGDASTALGGIFYGSTQTYFKKGITALSTDTSVDGQGSASISIVCPYYEDAQSFYVTTAEGTRIHAFHSLQEVQVYAKGRFTRKLKGSDDDVPVYYRVFWGIIDDIAEDLSGHTASFTLQCKDLLYFWQHEFMNIASTVDPFTLAMNKNQVSGPFNGSWGPLAGLNPWEIVATMFLNPSIYGTNLSPYGGIKTPDIAVSIKGANGTDVVAIGRIAGESLSGVTPEERRWTYLGRAKSMMDIWWSRLSALYQPKGYKRTLKNGVERNSVDVNAKGKLLPDFLEIYGVYGHRLIERTSDGKVSAGMSEADIKTALDNWAKTDTTATTVLSPEEAEKQAKQAAFAALSKEERDKAWKDAVNLAKNKAKLEEVQAAEKARLEKIYSSSAANKNQSTAPMDHTLVDVKAKIAAEAAKEAKPQVPESKETIAATAVKDVTERVGKSPFSVKFEFVDPMKPEGTSTTEYQGKNFRAMVVESALNLNTNSNPAGIALFRVRITRILGLYQESQDTLTVDAKTYADKLDGRFSRDMSVFESYQPYTNMKSKADTQSDFKSRYDIVKKAASDIGFEFFQDVNGNVVFKPPFFNADTSGHKSYVIEPGDVINFSESENGNSVVNYVEVRLPWLNNGLDGISKSGLYYDLGSMAKYGIRPQTIELPMSLGNSSDTGVEPLDILACVHCSLANAEVRTATVTLPLRPELRAGYPVYIHHLDCFYYIKQVAHSFSPDGSAQTTLTLNAKRERVRYFRGGSDARRNVVVGATPAVDDVMEGYIWKLAQPQKDEKDKTKTSYKEYTELDKTLLTNNSPVSWNFENKNTLYTPVFASIMATTTELQKSAWSNITMANRPEYLEYLTQRSIEHGLQSDNARAYKYNDPALGTSKGQEEIVLTHFTKDTRPFTDRSGFAHIGGLPFGADIQIVDPDNKKDPGKVVTPSDLYDRLGIKRK